MNAAVRVLCRPEVSAGFGMAGLRTVPAASATEAERRLRELTTRPDVGVVLVDQALHEALPPDVRRRLGRRPLPMIVPFPAPAWGERAAGAEAYIVELLRQVIGYRVRLR